jgi:hypothetical protein
MSMLLNVLAIVVTLESAWFLGRGALLARPELLAELSRPKYGYNLDVAQNLAGQVAEVRVGTVLLLLAAAMQMAALLVPASYHPLAARRLVVIVLVVAAVIIEVGSILSTRMATAQYAAVEAVLKRDEPKP